MLHLSLDHDRKMQWLPLILNGKSIDKALVCLYEEISFI